MERHILLLIVSIYSGVVSSSAIINTKFMRLPSAEVPTFNIRCQVYPDDRVRGRITCAALCEREGCYMFGVEANKCAICPRCSGNAPKPLGPAPFNTMYRIKSGLSCDPAFDQLPEGSCVRLVLTTKNWNNAITACTSYGGHLIRIDNACKADALDDYLERQGIGYGTQFWIGLIEGIPHGSYRWLDTGEPVSWSRWMGSQPNDYGPNNVMQLWFRQGWNDRVPSDLKRSICEQTMPE